MKDADLVIGDGHNIIASLAVGIPCIIVGDYGFGGRASLDNYKLQKENTFKGRLGGYRDEYIPSDLFFYQIRNIFNKTINEEEIEQLKKEVKKDFSFGGFKKLVNCQIDKIISIDKLSRKRSQSGSLKPVLIRILPPGI